MFSPHFLLIFSTPHFLRICNAEIRKKMRRKRGTPQRMRRSEVRVLKSYTPTSNSDDWVDNREELVWDDSPPSTPDGSWPRRHLHPHLGHHGYLARLGLQERHALRANKEVKWGFSGPLGEPEPCMLSTMSWERRASLGPYSVVVMRRQHLERRRCSQSWQNVPKLRFRRLQWPIWRTV